MTEINLAALDHALNLLPDRHRGPAGVAGVVKDGQVIARRAWGYADMARRVPMTTATRQPICSISKQMTCALLLDLFEGPEELAPLLPALLPLFRGPLPTIAQLCHNQSGLRDYWALTVLHGAQPDGVFTEEDGLRLIGLAKDGHFPPGAHYSYSNGNFRLLAELIARASGRDFGALLEERIFRPAGMITALLSPDMAKPLDGLVGYEGNDDVGFFPAHNAIHWFGDAGICASLDDMLAWEAHIDATRDDPASLYSRISVPVTFADGKPAHYGYGLSRDTLAGRASTGHGGGSRGSSSYRLHLPFERLSVVVMFNHEGSAQRACWSLIEATLGCRIAPSPVAASGWDGLWLDDDQDLLARTADLPSGVRLHYSPRAVVLTPTPDGAAEATHLRIWREDGDLRMDRRLDNLQVRAQPVEPVDWANGAEIAGTYRSDIIDASLEIVSRDGATYVVFDGMLGKGPMERMYPQARDLWSITTRRSMDSAPPGEWTVRVNRNASGAVDGLTLGCWLARGIGYRRQAN